MEQFNSQPACRLVLLYEGRHDYNVVTFPVDTLHPLLPELTVGYQGVAFGRLCLQWADWCQTGVIGTLAEVSVLIGFLMTWD